MKPENFFLNPHFVEYADYSTLRDKHYATIFLSSGKTATIEFDKKQEAEELIKELKANVNFRTEISYKGIAI